MSAFTTWIHEEERAAIHAKHRILTICGEEWGAFPAGGNWQYPGWQSYRLHDAPECVVWVREELLRPSC